MVLHTKEKTNIHVRGEPETKTKGRSINTVDRSPRVKSAEVSYTKAVNRRTTDKKAVRQNKNSTAQKENNSPGYNPLADKRSNGSSTGSHSRNGTAFHNSGEKSAVQDTCQKRRITSREAAPSIKIKRSAVKAAGMVGAGIISNQTEGGKEIKDSLLVADMIASPVISSAGKGADLFRKNQASLTQRKAKIKAVDHYKDSDAGSKIYGSSKYPASGSSTSGKEGSLTEAIKKKKLRKKEIILKKGEGFKAKDSPKNDLRRNETPTKKRALKKKGEMKKESGIDQSSVSTKGKTTTKSGTNIRSSKTKKNSSRNLMIASFLSRMGREENQVAVGKALKDVILMKVGILMKQMIAQAAGFLLFFFSLIAIACLPAVLVIAILYNSPFSLFLPPLQEEETVVSAAGAYEADFYAGIARLAEDHTGYDDSKVIYADYEGDGSPNNFYDVLAVYMVKHGIGDTAAVMNDTSKEWLKAVFADMCSYTTSVEIEETKRIVVEVDEYGEETEVVKTETKRILCIRVTLLHYQNMTGRYGFGEEEAELLAELLNPEYLTLLGYAGGGLTSSVAAETLSMEEYQSIINRIGDAGAKQAVSYALSKLGYPYSQPMRDSGTHYDCSSLTFYSWRSAGINISYEGGNTAAQQAKWCNDNGYTISFQDMQPGDLIFYSFGSNGRYLNVGHVAVYCGDGKLADASSSRGKVVYRDLYSTGNIVLIGRPQ